MALRRNVRPLLGWDQCRLVIVSSRRQTVHRDQRSRRVQTFYHPAVAYQVALLSALFGADQFWSAYLP